MLVRTRKTWELPEREATPEGAFWSRRKLMAAIAAGPILAATAEAFAAGDEPAAGPHAAGRNLRYKLDRPLTEQKLVETYNNFYEFGSHKEIARAARALKTRPWQLTIDGMVEEKRTVDVDDLLKAMQLEERLYRHRCVEAWAMTVPWTGFPMKDFVAWAKPLATARYVRLETFTDARVAPGQKQFWYPWPYVEGLTMAEAMNELAFLVTGAYGNSVANANGAPLRLAVPWKYGFKHVKSIVKITFTDERPVSFWEKLAANEYGFWANVNPEVPHPRWSQKTERMLGTDERRPTLLYNGYGEYVAEMYKGLEKERLFA